MKFGSGGSPTQNWIAPAAMPQAIPPPTHHPSQGEKPRAVSTPAQTQSPPWARFCPTPATVNPGCGAIRGGEDGGGDAGADGGAGADGCGGFTAIGGGA